MTLIFFRKPESPKRAELFFGFQGFPDHVEAGTSLSYVPPLQQPMGAPSSVHLGMKKRTPCETWESFAAVVFLLEGKIVLGVFFEMLFDDGKVMRGETF